MYSFHNYRFCFDHSFLYHYKCACCWYFCSLNWNYGDNSGESHELSHDDDDKPKVKPRPPPPFPEPEELVTAKHQPHHNTEEIVLKFNQILSGKLFLDKNFGRRYQELSPAQRELDIIKQRQTSLWNIHICKNFCS